MLAPSGSLHLSTELNFYKTELKRLKNCTFDAQHVLVLVLLRMRVTCAVSAAALKVMRSAVEIRAAAAAAR